MKYQSIYVAATGQHVGKTTSTLGLVEAFRAHGINNLAYCKPVGQEITDLFSQQVDKDAFLFSKTMDFELSPKLHSPVILGKGATTAYMDAPQNYDYENRIVEAAENLESFYDLVVYEGTGHPGVGSVVGLSNAKVAKLVNAKLVLVVEGGVGSTIDSMCYALTPFQKEGVPIAGVIVNKVIPAKRNKVEKYLQMKLDQMGIPLLGIVPFDKNMSDPIMQTIKRAIGGRHLFNEHKSTNSINRIISGSLLHEIIKVNNDEKVLLIVSFKRVNESMDRLKLMIKYADDESLPISGIILTGRDNKDNPEVTPENIEFIKTHEIPVISTKLDTLGAFTKINRLEVKINTMTPWKIARAIELIKENVNLNLLVKSN